MNRADTQQFGRRACQDFLLSRNILDCVASGFPDAILLSRTCAQVRTVLFLPRRVPMTFFVPDRRDFPDYGGDGPRRSAAIAGRTRHG
jgi:hypothetical protein